MTSTRDWLVVPDPAHALDLLDQIEELYQRYADATGGRSAVSDLTLRWRLVDKETGGELIDGLDVDNAMLAFYAADETPDAYGSEYQAEANYYAFADEVADAMDRIGIRQDEEDEE